MLDLDHPQTKYVFKASAIEDKIRAELLAMREAKGSAELIGRQERIQFVLTLELLELNKNHFGNCPKITNTIIALRDAVGKLDHAAAWECFLNLAERPGDNFGTWAI